MKMKYVFAGLLLAAAVGVSSVIGVRWSDQRLLDRTEDEVYEEVKDWKTDRLIRKINRLEKKLPAMPDKTALLPLYTVLIERSEEFSEDGLIEQIKRKETLTGIEEAFVKMYAAKQYDTGKMLALLRDPGLSVETKEYITSQCDFSLDELSEIFRSTDGKTATIAIKRISMKDSEAAMQLVNEFVSSDNSSVPDQKYISICLGIAKYYEEHRAPEDIEAMKNIYIPMMKKIFEQAHSDQVKDQAIYALGRICDYELFAWIIENDKISFYTKHSVAERNYRPMKQWIEEAESEDDIRAVLEAMEIYPMLEIADALEEAIGKGNLPDSEKLRTLIEGIRKNGIPAVDKYSEVPEK